MAKLISKTYGEALFELAVEEEKTDIILEEMEGMKNVFLENPEYLKFLNHPRIPVEEKVKTTEKIFADRVQKELVGFLSIVITKGRCEDLMDILEYFLDSAKEFKGIGVAYVTTPLELSQLQKDAVEQKLLATTNYQKMEMNFLIDEDLIGGMQIRIKDRVVDSSIRTKIAKMQQNLMQIQL